MYFRSGNRADVRYGRHTDVSLLQTAEEGEELVTIRFVRLDNGSTDETVELLDKCRLLSGDNIIVNAHGLSFAEAWQLRHVVISPCQVVSVSNGPTAVSTPTMN